MAKPPARGKRLFKLASMTASVATGYAKSKVMSVIGDKDAEEQSFRKASGERIAEHAAEHAGGGRAGVGTLLGSGEGVGAAHDRLLLLVLTHGQREDALAWERVSEALLAGAGAPSGADPSALSDDEF